MTISGRITAFAASNILPRRRYLPPPFIAHLPRPSPFPLLHWMVLLMVSLCHWQASRDDLRPSASADAESSFEKGSSTASRAVRNGNAGSSTILGTGSLPQRATRRSALYGACVCVHNWLCQPACSAAASAASAQADAGAVLLLMHGLSHLVLTACVHVGCLLVQKHGGAARQRKNEEWPFPGFSVFTAFHVLRRVHAAC